MRTVLLAAALLVFAAPALARVQGEEVTYRAGETEMRGYLVHDDAVKGKRPGVLVVHEWWGHDDYARQRARMLAEMGYTALAVDMYGGGRKASHPDDAKQMSGQLRQNLPLATERFEAGLKLLRQHPSVDGGKIAAIGYCFGGGVVLEMARRGAELAGVASFHGSLGTDRPAKAGDIKAQLLVLNGAADPFVTPEQIAAFNQEMAEAGITYHFVNYQGVKHSFTNPEADRHGQKFNLPLAYDREADRRSWQELDKFLREIFQPRQGAGKG
ncbi:MAG: dienelactone hydrolase family protein [Desulfuromonadales bacterium]|nr:dienelactone hydrolase family protein [Desulfuromonadales bacterium]